MRRQRESAVAEVECPHQRLVKVPRVIRTDFHPRWANAAILGCHGGKLPEWVIGERAADTLALVEGRYGVRTPAELTQMDGMEIGARCTCVQNEDGWQRAEDCAIHGDPDVLATLTKKLRRAERNRENDDE